MVNKYTDGVAPKTDEHTTTRRFYQDTTSGNPVCKVPLVRAKHKVTSGVHQKQIDLGHYSVSQSLFNQILIRIIKEQFLLNRIKTRGGSIA